MDSKCRKNLVRFFDRTLCKTLRHALSNTYYVRDYIISNA